MELDIPSSLVDSEEHYRLVPYGCPPPLGFWHNENGDEGELIDYVPRGDSWYFSHGLGATQRYHSGQSQSTKSAQEQEPEFFSKTLGSIHLVPVDHRISLGTNLRSLQYLSSAAEFIAKLKKDGGCYWVKDFDLQGNSIEYALPLQGSCDARGERRTTATVGQLKCPGIEWPDPWHATRASHSKLQVSRPGAPPIKAPWRRLVVLEGLSVMARKFDMRKPSGPYYYQNNSDIGEKRAKIPLLFDTTVDWLIDQHLAGVSGIADYTLTSGYAFQVSWLEVNTASEKSAISTKESTSGSLMSGLLYGTETDKNPKLLCHEAYTIYAVPEDDRPTHAMSSYPSLEEMETTQDYWTILILASLPGSVVFPELRSYDDQIQQMQITMLRLIIIGLLRAWHGFQTLKLHVDGLLRNGSEIFKPEDHDRLLFDDEVYSNSRKFSWLINTLYEVDRILEQNIMAWDKYHDRFIRPAIRKSKFWTGQPKAELMEKVTRCKEIRDKLDELRSSFGEQKTRTLSLREGMFSASSIMESRASTRLGENVQLLTFVSIFYLPLAFCTSLWSTTDTFNFNTLAFTMVLVALTTYLLVFNLRSIVNGTQKSYLRWKIDLVREMKVDENGTWRATGERFERFRSRIVSKETRPSEWAVVAFGVRKLVGKVGLCGTNRSKEDSQA